MKGKKAANNTGPASVGSNGIVKKKNKKNKMAQKLASNQELKEAVVAASGITTPPSNGIAKKKNKKNKLLAKQLTSNEEPKEVVVTASEVDSKSDGIVNKKKNKKNKLTGQKMASSQEEKEAVAPASDVPKTPNTNGIVKKKNKKNKLLAKKMASNQELKEAVVAVAGITTPASPKNKKKKNKKNKSQESSDNTQKMDAVSQKATGEVKVPIKEKGVQNSMETATTPVPESKNAEKTGKKNKKRTKTGLAKGGLSTTPETNEEKERRTIFVGNVSTKTTRKSLTQFFSKYGKVEAVRLRCAAVAAPDTTKKVAVITNTFHEKRSSLSAFVRFTEEAMVEEALKANGAELDQKHLHVDRSQPPAERNNKLAVFVGNLAFEAEEEDLRSHFASCGEIESVRIVRDKKLASGKGFGYVNFTSEDAVEMALQMNGQVFMHRQLRVQRCTKQGKKISKPGFKTKGKKGLSFMKTKAPSPKNSKTAPSFSGKKMIETKKFKKMKAKSKFTKEDRKKKAIAHKLTGPTTKGKKP